MSMTLHLTVRGDPAGDAERKLDGITSLRMHKVMCKEVGLEVQLNFARRKSEPNKMGFHKTGFYAACQRSTTWSADERAGTVGVAKEGVRQRYFGGTIKPVNVGALTVPVADEAYGSRATESKFSDLVMIKFKQPRGRLIGLLMKPKPKGETGMGKIYYLLMSSVSQRPDPSVMPPRETILQAMSRAIKRLFRSSAGETPEAAA
jgi:hypothetical protein